MGTLDPLTDSDMRALARLSGACDSVTTRPETMDRFERAGLVRNRQPRQPFVGESGDVVSLETAAFTSFGLGVIATSARLLGGDS